MRVKDLMKRPVITIDEGASLREAMALMADRQIRRLPVVRGRTLVGILTDRDCRRVWASPAPAFRSYELTDLLEALRVREAMTRDVLTVTPDAPVREAARLIHDRRIGGLPVVEGTEITGILTVTELLDALVQLLEEKFPTTIHQILVPVDLSEAPIRAVQHARDLARLYAAKLILLHIVSPPRIAQVEGELSRWVLDRMRETRERETLARMRAAFPDGEGTRYRVVAGHPEDEIPKVARAEAADLIVMATHGRTGLAHFLAGSVTEEVLRQAPCPVLALRG